ncbi:helix-turn-helix transcriptional regulator [Formosimonas limnophila]|uniref:helix-turn-helix transcriptional regulator n=1 Tax=Formosimonas limnophila TaxID=1384487 RepID=UPI001671A5C1|nr:helix-turn-helix domain-containing protein [Formosimonas limnophila]
MNLVSTQHTLPAILTTNEAAVALNRKPQTLRKWACLGNAPITPLRINGRLAWRASEVLALLNPHHVVIADLGE